MIRQSCAEGHVCCQEIVQPVSGATVCAGHFLSADECSECRRTRDVDAEWDRAEAEYLDQAPVRIEGSTDV